MRKPNAPIGDLLGACFPSMGPWNGLAVKCTKGLPCSPSFDDMGDRVLVPAWQQQDLRRLIDHHPELNRQ